MLGSEEKQNFSRLIILFQERLGKYKTMKEVFEPILFKPSSFLSCDIETSTFYLKLKSQDSLASLRHTLLHDIVFLIQWCDFPSVLSYCISFFSNFFLPASMPDYCSLIIQYFKLDLFKLQAILSWSSMWIPKHLEKAASSKPIQVFQHLSGQVVLRWRSKFAIPGWSTQHLPRDLHQKIPNWMLFVWYFKLSNPCTGVNVDK